MRTAQFPRSRVAMDHRRRYLAMLSHDMKSAISGTIGALQQIAAAELDPKSRQYRDGALESALAAARLLEGALDLEAIDSEDFKLETERVPLDEFLGEIHRRWNAVATRKNIDFTILRPDDFPADLWIDRGRLARALGNLIENAIKYTDVGSVSLKIGRSDTGDFAITISDSGPGFSPSSFEHLFEFRGRPEDSAKPGSGLGLYIASSVVEQMGGSISASNASGGGAMVFVTLPEKTLGDATFDEQQTDAASVSVLPSTRLPDLSSLHILLAEDNATNQLVVTQMLDAMGATFEVASDGVEALSLLEASTFDLALLDIEMPRLSGLDVIRSIRSRTDDRAGMPVVALTAYAMREHRERIAAAGADGLIAKPILGIEDLGEAVLGYWNRHKGVKPPSSQPATGVPEAGTIIDEGVFAALEASIGSERMEELLRKIVTDLGGVRDGIEQGLEGNDIDAIRAASHVMISVSGAIGAGHAQHAAETLNKAANSGDTASTATLGANALQRIDELLAVVTQRL